MKRNTLTGWGSCGAFLVFAGCASTLSASEPRSLAPTSASAVARVVIDRGAGAAPLTVEARAHAAHVGDGQVLSESVARVILAPHGRWETTSLGEVWFPEVAQRETFEPFVTHGQWSDAPAGPKWQSVFSWGVVAFHYGRWLRVGAEWAWQFDAAYRAAPVRWRVAGRYVGWSVEGDERWCWLSFDGLFAPSPSTRAVRGRAAAPLAAASVDHGFSVGWTADLRGRPPTGNPSTTGAAESDAQSTVEPVTVARDRWATVVIRDDSALDRFDEVRAFETPPSSTSAPIAVPSVVASVTPAIARRDPAATNLRPAARTGLWSDQERARPTIVANIAPRFEPFVRPTSVRVEPVLQPMTAPQPTIEAAPERLPHTNSSTPPVAPYAGGGIGGGGLRLAPLATTPAVATPSVAAPVRVLPAAATTVRAVR
ncbi:MAG: hypothetical protein JNK05_31675 [Myxococcales bacterium]|nr:hypothetical protein [Myxococcales bacterium]